MTRLSRILAGALVVLAVAVPSAGAASALTTDAPHIMPMGEGGCC